MSATIEGLAELSEIGRGGFGVVYRAAETDLGRTVAVKVLPPLVEEGAQLRFERERLALGAMSGHPNIVTIHRTGRTDDEEPYLVMEFCDQGSIGDEIARIGPLPWPRATDVVVKMAGALETAHRAGIVHRDIKPANILVSNLNEPKLADFGIARVEGAPETQTASITASLAHAAPEVLAGTRPDARSDVYSLGSTCYELLTGRAAFERPGEDSMLPILNRIARDPVPPIHSSLAPSAVVDVIRAAMEKRPEDRPSTALELGRMLADAQARAGIAPTSMMIEGDAGAATIAAETTPPGGHTGSGVASGPSPPAGPTVSTDPSLGPAPAPVAASQVPASSVTTPVGHGFQAPSPSSWAPPSTSAGSAPRGAGPGGGHSSWGAWRWVAAIVAALAVVGAIAAIVRIGAGSAEPEVAADGADEPESGPITEPPTTGTVDDTEPESEPEEATEAPPVPTTADEPLTIGALFPQSGNLSPFGPPLTAAVELAVDDINAAGGVLGHDVQVVSGDTSDQDADRVRSEVDRFGNESVDVIVGPLTTGDSALIIEAIDTGDTVIISPSATAQRLTDIDAAGTYFRTAPSEVTMGHVTAQILTDRGLDRLALVHIDDAYGSGLSEDIRLRYAQLGGVVVVNTSYDPDGDLSPVVAELAEAGAEAIVIIGFNETVDVIAALAGQGIGPKADGTPIFGVDANYLLDGDPGVIDGYQSIVAQIDLRPLGPFTDRLAERGFDFLTYTPEAYDAAIIAALAAEVSGVTSGPDLAAAIVDVTKDGEKCFDYAECRRMITEGADIDYDGLGGPYELTDAGDPRVASYVVSTYDGGVDPNPDLNEYVFSR